MQDDFAQLTTSIDECKKQKQTKKIAYVKQRTCPHEISRIDRIQQHIRNLLIDRHGFYIEHFLHHRAAIHIVGVGRADPTALGAFHHFAHDVVGGGVAGVLRGELE